MKKRGWGRKSGAAGLALACLAAQTQALAQQQQGGFGARNARLSSVRLESREAESGQKTWSGTGFFVRGHELALTNNHVASEAALHPGRSRLVAVFADGSEAVATVVMADAALDLAALSIPRRPTARLELRAREPELGEPTAGAGYGLGLDFSLSQGRVAALSSPRAASPRLQLSAATDGGVSGGPTLDARGAAIGVNVSAAGSGVGLSIPAASAEAFLSRAEKAEREGGSWSGKTEEQVRVIYAKQVGDAGLAALSAAMERSAAPARLGPWSVWAPSPQSSWSCHGLSAKDKGEPEPWQSRAQGFFCSMVSAPMAVGRADAGSAWSYAATRLDARAENSWGAWAEWVAASVRGTVVAEGRSASCQTRAFRYRGGLGRAQVCAEAVKDLPGLYAGSVGAWVDDPSGPGALMVRLDFDGLSPEGVEKAAAWIQSQVGSAPGAAMVQAGKATARDKARGGAP